MKLYHRRKNEMDNELKNFLIIICFEIVTLHWSKQSFPGYNVSNLRATLDEWEAVSLQPIRNQLSEV